MNKFKIIREDPNVFQEQIISFWKEYLPGTPSRRLDWMINNPAGSSIWLFALEKGTGTLVGTISIMPKELYLDNKCIKAGILGDLMIHKKHRLFGPALNLLKEAIAILDQEEFNFLYTIPNLGSKKILERVGFRESINLHYMMSPQKLNFLSNKYFGQFWADFIEKPLSWILKILSIDTYVKHQNVIEEIDWQDESINKFHQRFISSRPGMMVGKYHLPYLKWRYMENPEFDFKAYSIRRSYSEDVQGVFFMSVNSKRIEIYDIVGLEDIVVYQIIYEIKKYAKSNDCLGSYCMVSETNPLLSMIKKCNFFDTKYNSQIYLYPNKPKEVERWCFTSADRNI